MQGQPTTPDADRGTSAFLGVLGCFVLSGFAGLLYQTAWLRQFSIVFGTSELAVAAVLAAYMAGLALGAWIAGRFIERVRRPVLVYGALELGIALGALAVPLGLRLVRGLQGAVIGSAELAGAGGTLQAVFHLLAAFLVLLVPTTFMGATLPLLTRHAVRRREHVGSRVGLLYATNTGGAVLGTVVAAFVLLPRLGLGNTVLVGVAVNALVFALAVAIARLAPAPVGEEAAAEAADRSADEAVSDRRAAWILPLMLASGAVSFTYEVLWTRLLSHVTGASVYAFASMLASFLCGITLGSAVASWFARNRRSSAVGFALAQVGVAWLSVWVYRRMDALPSEMQALLDGTGSSTLLGALHVVAGSLMDAMGAGSGRAAGAALSFFVLLPATLCIGATFPFAVRLLARGRADAAHASARVYAWNTVGAIAGAILAGFVVVPALGFEGTVRAGVAVSAALAVGGMALLWPSARAGTAVAGVAGAAALALVGSPPDTLLRFAPLQGVVSDEEILFSAVGRSASVIVLDEPDGYQIRSNGLPEATITPRGAPSFLRNSPQMLTVLPVIARPATETMLVVGFGGGVCLEAIPPSVRTVDVVELEPEILAANRRLSDLRQSDPLRDPRLRITLNDARGALMLTDARWDVIVSQPSHPWTAGASHLYTREFLELCRDHLTEGGVFVQWIHVGFVDEALLASMGATILDAFPHVRVYRPDAGMMLFLASEAPLDVERQVARTGLPFSRHRAFYEDVGVSTVSDVVALLALEEDGLRALSAGAPVSTDDRNVFAMRTGLHVDVMNQARLWDFLSPQDPLLDLDSPLSRDLAGSIDRAYIVRRTIYTHANRALSSIRVPKEAWEQKLLQGIARQSWALADFAGGFEDLRSAMMARPNDDRVLFAAAQRSLREAAEGAPGSEEVRAIADRLSGEARTVWEAWKLAAARDWNAILELDEALAAVSPTELWYVDAARLRALARVRAGGPPQAMFEAMGIVDRALHREPDIDLLWVRLQAAGQANQPFFILGTLEAFVALPEGLMLRAADTLLSWRDALDRWPRDGQVPASRIVRVLEKLRQL